MNIDWSKAPEDATHYSPGGDVYSASWIKWVNGELHGWLKSNDTSWGRIPSQEKDLDQISLHIERPKKQDAWDGEGLPPVGLDVEIKRGNCTWIDGDEWQIGKTATVMASFLNSRDIEMASVQFPGGHCECILARCLSPIRTSEQVAAEEWDKARTEALNAMTANGKTANEPEALWKFRLKVVGEMLDMGYRKQ